MHHTNQRVQHTVALIEVRDPVVIQQIENKGPVSIVFPGSVCLFCCSQIGRKLLEILNQLRHGGGLIGPLFFQRPTNSQKNLKCQKSEKNSVAPLRSLRCTLCFNFYQRHRVCLQNAFEKTYPESRSPKGSCHTESKSVSHGNKIDVVISFS
jgi:hypothetical protein